MVNLFYLFLGVLGLSQSLLFSRTSADVTLSASEMTPTPTTPSTLTITQGGATLGTYDTDGSGELEKQECVKALSSLLPGITDDEIGVLVDLIDTDKSETLTVDEITDFLLDSHKNRDAQETSLHFG